MEFQTRRLNKGNWTSSPEVKGPDASCLVVHIEELVLYVWDYWAENKPARNKVKEEQNYIG